MILFAFFVVFAILFYLKIIRPHKYWSDKGVKTAKGWPLLGLAGPLMFKTKSAAEAFQDIYNCCPEERYCGFYITVLPCLMIRDPELIKQIIVKEFDAYHDHRTFPRKGTDPLWEKNVFAMTGEPWRIMRSTISPAFTSGKLRAMFNFFRDCAKQTTDFYENKGELVPVELKDIYTRYTNDVLASTMFGITNNSFVNRENEFFMIGQDAANLGGIRRFRMTLATFSYVLAWMLGTTVFDKHVCNFFQRIVNDALRYRKENNVIRPDMIHLLTEARKGRLKNEDKDDNVNSGFASVQESEFGRLLKQEKPEITDEDIVAQVMIFYLAGFETSSTLMSHVSYALAMNLDIQNKLRREIDETLAKCGGEMTYDALFGMKYLDMVMSEALRLWPGITFIERVCTKPSIIEAKLPSETNVYVEPGTPVWIPVYAMHRDPQYFPDPEKFDPERFSDENKANILPNTYMPFSTGPRNCIGSRFGLLQSKIIIAQMISKFEIVLVNKSQVPLTLSKDNIFPVAEYGFWVGLKPRNKTA